MSPTTLTWDSNRKWPVAICGLKKYPLEYGPATSYSSYSIGLPCHNMNQHVSTLRRSYNSQTAPGWYATVAPVQSHPNRHGGQGSNGPILTILRGWRVEKCAFLGLRKFVHICPCTNYKLYITHDVTIRLYRHPTVYHYNYMYSCQGIELYVYFFFRLGSANFTGWYIEAYPMIRVAPQQPQLQVIQNTPFSHLMIYQFVENGFPMAYHNPNEKTGSIIPYSNQCTSVLLFQLLTID